MIEWLIDFDSSQYVNTGGHCMIAVARVSLIYKKQLRTMWVAAGCDSFCMYDVQPFVAETDETDHCVNSQPVEDFLLDRTIFELCDWHSIYEAMYYLMRYYEILDAGYEMSDALSYAASAYSMKAGAVYSSEPDKLWESLTQHIW